MLRNIGFSRLFDFLFPSLINTVYKKKPGAVASGFYVVNR